MAKTRYATSFAKATLSKRPAKGKKGGGKGSFKGTSKELAQKGRGKGSSKAQSAAQPKKVPATGALKCLCPSAGGVSLRFVILESRGKFQSGPKDGREFWIADETGSGSLVVGEHLAQHLSPGDIFRLVGAEASHGTDQRLRVYVGARARLERAGFFTLAFREEPDVSAAGWAPSAKDLEDMQQGRDSKPVANTGMSLKTAVQKEQSVQEDRAANGPRADSVQQGRKTCFLCNDDHAVFDCPVRARGLALFCEAFPAMEPAERKPEIVRALEEYNLPRPCGMRFYWKEGSSSLMYLLFDTEGDAKTVWDHSRDSEHPWHIAECRAKCFRIFSDEEKAAAKAQKEQKSGKAKGKSDKGKGKSKGKGKGQGKSKKEASSVQTLEESRETSMRHQIDDLEPNSEEASRKRNRAPDSSEAPCKDEPAAKQAKRDRGQRISCFFCSAEHDAASCPYITRCVSVIGLPSEAGEEPSGDDMRAFKDLLQKHDIEVVSATWRRPRASDAHGKSFVRLASMRQARKITGIAQQGRLKLNGDFLRVYPFKSAKPAAAAAAPEIDNEKAEVAAACEVACPICSSTEHRDKECPERDCCVQSCGLDRDIDTDERLVEAARAQGIEILHMWWSKRTCQMKLSSPDMVGKIISCAMQGLLEITVEKDGVPTQRKLKVYPLRRYTESAASVALQSDKAREHGATQGSEAPTRKALKFATRNARKCCFLCGAEEHEVPTCPVREECVLIAREWGAAHGNASLHAILNEKLCGTLHSAGLTVRRAHWHKTVCYVWLGSAEEAQKLISAAAVKGLTCEGELLRVRAARSSKTGQANAEADDNQEEAAATDWASTSCCPLCGEQSHNLQACQAVNTGVAVHSSGILMRGADTGLVEEEFNNALRQWGLEAAKQSRVHDGVLFVTLSCEADVQQVLEAAVGEGLELAGELASVQRASNLLPGGFNGGQKEAADSDEEELHARRKALRPKGRLKLISGIDRQEKMETERP